MSKAGTGGGWRAATAGLLTISLLIVAGVERVEAGRYALVVGNSSYQHVGQLKNPRSDAELMSTTLQAVGFQVWRYANLSAAEMKAALREFRGHLGRGDAAVVYFSGHGFQCKGENWLVPVDFDVKYDYELPTAAVSLTEVQNMLGSAHTQPKLVFLDCCRDTHEFRALDRDMGNGLATPKENVDDDTLICFATRHGKTAQDNSDQANSNYTRFLAREITRSGGAPIEKMLKAVTADVREASSGEQVPWVYGNLTVDFSFTGGNAAAASPLPILSALPSSVPDAARPIPAATPASVTAGAGAGRVRENSLGMRFVRVPGCPALFSIWETRLRDFQAFASATHYDAGGGMVTLGRDGWKQRGGNWQQPGFAQGPTHPVTRINWDTANAFCRWLTEKERAEGKLRADEEYRLPTDREWSTAVGLPPEHGDTPAERNGRVPGVYPWGRQWPPPADAGNFRGQESRVGQEPDKWSMIPDWRDNFARTAPVGSFQPNVYGLYDMSGNVWEWCEDLYRPGQTNRVIRGGSWRNERAADLLASRRDDNEPDSQDCILGFRCVLAPVR